MICVGCPVDGIQCRFMNDIDEIVFRMAYRQTEFVGGLRCSTCGPVPLDVEIVPAAAA